MSAEPSTPAAAPTGAAPSGTWWRLPLPDLPGLAVRRLDLPWDAEALATLAREVSAADDGDWFPTTKALLLEWTPSPTFEPARDAILVFDGGSLVGAVDVDWRERAAKVVHVPELRVTPSHRGRGIEAALLAWAEAHIGALVSDGLGGRPDLPHELGAGASEAQTERIALLEARGYRPARWFFDMRRSLAEPIPSADLPPGIEIRPVMPEQHRQIWDADIEGFRDHWEAAVRLEEDFTMLFSHPNTDTSLWRIAWDGDEVVGVVLNSLEPRVAPGGGEETVGLVEHVSTRRPWRGRGIATALIVTSLQALRERGLAEAELGVDADSPTGALGLYERLGFWRHRSWTVYRKPL